MSYKEIAFLANWAKNDCQFVEMAASITRYNRIAVQAVLHSLEKAALKVVEDEKINTLKTELELDQVMLESQDQLKIEFINNGKSKK
jgi:hypothetical protein